MALFVNGERIEEEIVRQEFSGIKFHHAHRGQVSCCERDDEFRRLAVDNVVTQTLLLQEARRTIPPVPEAEFEAALRRIQKEHGGPEKFYAAFLLTADDEPRTRRDLEARLRLEKLIEQVAGHGPEPSREELEAYYARNLERYRTAEQVRASHILKNGDCGEERTRTMELQRGLRERALAGEDFEALAREHSDRARRDGASAPRRRGRQHRPRLVRARRDPGGTRGGRLFSARRGGQPRLRLPLRLPSGQAHRPAPPEPVPFDRIRHRVREDFLAERWDGRCATSSRNSGERPRLKRFRIPRDGERSGSGPNLGGNRV